MKKKSVLIVNDDSPLFINRHFQDQVQDKMPNIYNFRINDIKLKC